MPYSFKVGEKVKFKLFEAYGHYDPPLNVWCWFKILTINPDKTVTLEVLNGDKPEGRQVTAPIAQLEIPLGWEEQYTIVNEDEEKLKMMTDWLKNRSGITIWKSLDLGSAGRQMFTPGDRQEKPHWSMGLVEVVTDPKRIKFKLLKETLDKPSAKEKKQFGWQYDRHLKVWWREEEWEPK